MKRILPLLVAILLVVGVVAVCAQDTGSKMFVKTVPLVKILTAPDGYKLLYVKGSLDIGEVYLPRSWFSAGGKAELVMGEDPSYPYFSVFWKDGQFDFIRVYAWQDVRHPSWGVLKGASSDRFNVSDLQLEF